MKIHNITRICWKSFVAYICIPSYPRLRACVSSYENACMCVRSLNSMCMIDCICECVCVFACLNTCKQAVSLCVQTNFLVGDAGVQREHEDEAPTFHTTNPSGMLGVPARMKPPLREFSMEIHQHVLIPLKAHLCCSLCSSAVIRSKGLRTKQ